MLAFKNPYAFLPVKTNIVLTSFPERGKKPYRFERFPSESDQNAYGFEQFPHILYLLQPANHSDTVVLLV